MNLMRRAAGLVVLLVILAFGGEVLADCIDGASEGVVWRRCQFDGDDLRGATLTGAELRDSSFKRADLSGAMMANSKGRRTKFVTAIMRDVVLDGGQYDLADFTKADLTGASMRNMVLRRARLFQAILVNVDLTGANLEGADLLHADLSGALWVDGVSRCGPGSVGRCHVVREPSAAPKEDETTN